MPQVQHWELKALRSYVPAHTKSTGIHCGLYKYVLMQTSSVTCAFASCLTEEIMVD